MVKGGVEQGQYCMDRLDLLMISCVDNHGGKPDYHYWEGWDFYHTWQGLLRRSEYNQNIVIHKL